MSLKEIAVEELTLEPQGIVIPNTGTLTITSIPSIKNKAEGKGIYSGTLTFTLVGANATGYDPGTVLTVGVGSINATSLKVNSHGQKVLRVDDNNPTVSMTGAIGGTLTPFVEPWKISNGGQSKVQAE
jgi:hypothetical protein